MAIPTSDAALPAYVTNFSAKLVASPTVYGTVAQAAQTFAQLVSAYTTAQTALVAAREAGVRSEPLRDARDLAKKNMLPSLRSFYRTIQGNKDISDQARTEIGVHNPKSTRTPTGKITDRPEVDVVSVNGRTVAISVHGGKKLKTTRPKEARGAWLYTFVGTSYPSDPSLWAFQGSTTKSRHTITFPDTVADGAQVWVCAAWLNRLDEAGPVSNPVSTYLQGGGVAYEQQELKIAA